MKNKTRWAGLSVIAAMTVSTLGLGAVQPAEASVKGRRNTTIALGAVTAYGLLKEEQESRHCRWRGHGHRLQSLCQKEELAKAHHRAAPPSLVSTALWPQLAQSLPSGCVRTLRTKEKPPKFSGAFLLSFCITT